MTRCPVAGSIQSDGGVAAHAPESARMGVKSKLSRTMCGFMGPGPFRASPQRSCYRSMIQVSSFHQGTHLAIRHRAEHHPEATVRVHPPDALRPEDLDRLLDAPGDQARRFRLV